MDLDHKPTNKLCAKVVYRSKITNTEIVRNYDVISDDFHVDTIHHEVLTSSEKIKYYHYHHH